MPERRKPAPQMWSNGPSRETPRKDLSSLMPDWISSRRSCNCSSAEMARWCTSLYLSVAFLLKAMSRVSLWSSRHALYRSHVSQEIISFILDARVDQQKALLQLVALLRWPNGAPCFALAVAFLLQAAYIATSPGTCSNT